MKEQQQSSKEYSYQVITLPNAVPFMPHDQAIMPQDRVIHTAPEGSHNEIFMPPAAAQTACCEPHCAGYTQYYGPPTLSDSTSHTYHRTQCTPQPTMQLNNIAPAQPCGTVTRGPPFFDVPFGGMAENTTVPLGRPPKRARQDFNDAGYNPAIQGTSMANINKDLAVRFVNDPGSKITVVRTESSAGRSKVTIELEIDNAN